MRGITILMILLAGGLAAAVEPAPGLILRMEGGGQADARVVRNVALFVPEGRPAAAFLPPGPFKAAWEGKLVLEKRSRLVFTLEGTGKARLLIDGEILVDGTGKSNESKRLSSGEHSFVCEYESPADGDARLRLFWEERDFDREPVPARVFVHDAPAAAVAGHLQVREGRRLLAEKRCTACHSMDANPAMPDLLLDAPGLTDVGARLRSDWLARWIADPQAVRATTHMPAAFGDDAGQAAADIAAYLAMDAPEPDQTPTATPGRIAEGGHIFEEQGCIGCHSLGADDDDGRLGLGGVGRKYRPAALVEFLRAPATFHKATRMPDFQFAREEASALAAFLRSLGRDAGALPAKGDAANGKTLLATRGCLDCHSRGEEKSQLTGAAPLAQLGGADCASMRYQLSDREREALAAAITSKAARASLARRVPAEFSHRQYESLRCDACHARDGREPLRETFAAEVAHLARPAPEDAEETPGLTVVPPPLDHLGFKLRPEWRRSLFAGEIPSKVRPWLPARMPVFASRAEMLSTGFSHAVGLGAVSPPGAPVDPARVTVGADLVSAQGLACVTCHGIGEQPAIAVFEGEGPNFARSAERLNREYYHLWMNDPLRAWPGTIMPKYANDGATQLTRHYDGDAKKQFDAIFEFLRSGPGKRTEEPSP